MKYLAFFSLFFFSFFPAFNQTKISFTRQDSAIILENNKLYEEYLQQGDKKEASRYLDNNAVIYWKHNYFDEAIKFYKKSLTLNEQLGNHNGIAGINSNLALIYADKQDYPQAFEYFEKTLSIRKMNDEKVGIISALINESVVLNKMNKFDVSVKKLEEALSLAQEMNDEKQMRSIYGMLSETYQKAGNTEKAMYYYEYYKTFNDYVTEKIVTETNQKYKEELLKKQLLELENQNKQLQIQNQNLLISKQQKKIGEITQEQQLLIDSLDEVQMSKKILEQKSTIQRLENQKLKDQKKKQQIIIIIILSALITVVTLLFFIISILRQKEKLNKKLLQKNQVINQQKAEISTQRDELLIVNKILEEKNKQITASISYALRIQKAVFSGSRLLSSMAIDSFSIFKPKDIVSGDFLFFQQIDNKKIFIVGDCTGHGVPGAFLTLLGINFLNTIIFDKKISMPDIILKELDTLFQKILHQGKMRVADGMDIAICVYDEDKSEFYYSGARNPIIIVLNNEVQYIKATKKSIGPDILAHKNTKFERKVFSIPEKTWVYMFSDGITDMMTKDFKKYTLTRLINKIKEIFPLPGKKQKSSIEKEINSWQQDAEQIDDISIIGINLKN